MSCEDFPCCGHEMGCCPDFDPDTGAQLNMKCVCGATVPLTSRSSLCASCLHPPTYGGGEYGNYYGSWEDYEGHYESAYETDAEW